MKKMISLLAALCPICSVFCQNDDVEFNSARLNTLHFKTTGKYLHYNTGGDYADFGSIPNAVLNGNYLLHAANFNNYAPSLTGSGASGNWNINAASAVNWGGTATYTNSGLTGTPAYIMTFESENSTWKPADVVKIRSFMGMPAGGETLQSVMERDNKTTTGMAAINGSELVVCSGPFNSGDAAFSIKAVGINNTGYADFQTFYHNVGYMTPLVINKNGGNVGIGTTTPAYKLDVNGSGNFNGYIRVQSTGGNNPLIGSRNPLYLDALHYGSSNSSAIVFTKGNSSICEIATDLLANGGKDLYMIAGASASNILLNPFDGIGNVGIGTTNPQSKLAVKGTITSMKVKVTQDNWSDYVFDSSYQLTPLSQVEQYIQSNKHLRDVPSTADVKKDGLDLGDNQATLLRKIEELTLYIIQQNKELNLIREEMKDLRNRVK